MNVLKLCLTFVFTSIMNVCWHKIFYLINFTNQFQIIYFRHKQICLFRLSNSAYLQSFHPKILFTACILFIIRMKINSCKCKNVLSNRYKNNRFPKLLNCKISKVIMMFVYLISLLSLCFTLFYFFCYHIVQLCYFY